jgi:hypothetical protein
VWRFFLDHFGENPLFIALGEQIHHPFLEAVFAQIGEQILGRKVDLSELILKRVPDHYFVHGGGLLGGSLFNVLYFEDTHAGMMAVAMLDPLDEMKYVRFSGRRLPGLDKPSVN